MTTWRQSIWRHRWLSVALAWLVCVAGWVAIAVWPTSYNASAVMFANFAELSRQTDTAVEQGPVGLLRAMLLSDDNLRAVEETGTLAPARLESLQNDFTLRSTVPPLFVATYTHDDADIAKQVLNTLLVGLQNQLDQVKSASEEAKSSLDSQISDHNRRLQIAEAALVEFRRTHADQLNGTAGRSEELARQRAEAKALEDDLNAKTEQRDQLAAELAKARNPEAGDDGAQPVRSSAEVEQERRTLEDELAKLQQRYADSHPYVVAVVDALDSLEAEVASVTPIADGDDSADGTPADRVELEQRHGELIVEVSTLDSELRNKEREIELLEALTNTAGSVEADLAELEAERQSIETALNDLQQRRDGLGEDDGGQAKQEAFRLIKRPELPENPVGPSRLMALAAVLFGGVGFGAVAAISCSRYKGVFESAWQLRQRFDVGVLGTISEVMTPAERRKLTISRLTFGFACLALIGLFGGLAVAEMNHQLAPLGDHLRSQLLG